MSVHSQELELAMGEAHSGSESTKPHLEDGSVYRIRWWAIEDSNQYKQPASFASTP